MSQKPDTDSETPDRETVSLGKWICRRVMLVVCCLMLYLLMTGPLLWSYSKFENETWTRFIRISLAPILKLEAYEKREFYNSMKIGVDQFSRDDWPDDPLWLSGLKWYWDLYGDGTNNIYFLFSMSEWPTLK